MIEYAQSITNLYNQVALKQHMQYSFQACRIYDS
jgi:hypothetical protein